MWRRLVNLLLPFSLLLSTSSSVSARNAYTSRNRDTLPPIYLETDVLTGVYPQVNDLAYKRPHERNEINFRGVQGDIDGDGIEDLAVPTKISYQKYSEEIGRWVDISPVDSRVYIYYGYIDLFGSHRIPPKPSRVINYTEKIGIPEIVDFDLDGDPELVLWGQDQSGELVNDYSNFIEVYRGDRYSTDDLLFGTPFYGEKYIMDVNNDGIPEIVIENIDNRCNGHFVCIQGVRIYTVNITESGVLVTDNIGAIPRHIRYRDVLKILEDLYGNSMVTSTEFNRVLNVFREGYGGDVVDEAYAKVKLISSKQDKFARILEAPDQPLSTSISRIQDELRTNDPELVAYVVQKTAVENDIWVSDGERLLPLSLLLNTEPHPIAELVTDKVYALSGFEAEEIPPEAKEALAVMLTYTGREIYLQAGGEFDEEGNAIIPGTDLYVKRGALEAVTNYITARKNGRQSDSELEFQKAMRDVKISLTPEGQEMLRDIGSGFSDLSSEFRNVVEFFSNN